MNDENAGCFTAEAARDKIRERWGITDKDTMKAKREAEEAVKPLSNIERLSGIERKLDGIKDKLDRLISQSVQEQRQWVDDEMRKAKQSADARLSHVRVSNLAKWVDDEMRKARSGLNKGKDKLDRLVEQRQSENEQLKHIKLSNLSKREHVNKSG